MRIAIISDWFSEKMGYSENCLPKALASLGHEVHLVTSNVQPYFNSPAYASTYEPFIGPGVVATEVKTLDGFTLHRLPHGRIRGRLRIQGLRGALTSLRPDVVQAFEVPNLSTLEAAWAKGRIGCKLFLESHVHASVFPVERIRENPKERVWWWTLRHTAGAFVNSRTERCYPISLDAAELAVEWFGIAQDKIRVCSLGVDTDVFVPPISPSAKQARAEQRARLGFGEDDIVCIYTGRFAANKGPQLLADAIDQLACAGEPFRALFVGSGTDAERSALEERAGCRLHPFVPARDLPRLYWAADIGVWPMQESTSQLDAAACGLPIILSGHVAVTERVDGNGLTYDEGDVRDLAAKILSLKSAKRRTRLGEAGSEKMRAFYSWRRIAEERAQDYEASLSRRS
jgi:glycosyltransferase involved in cell wall biosynthesis